MSKIIMPLMKPCKIVFCSFPESENPDLCGFAREDLNEYVIAINTKLPKDVQKITMKHEFAHILLNHVDRYKAPTKEEQERNEIEAEEYATEMTDETLQHLLKKAHKIERW